MWPIELKMSEIADLLVDPPAFTEIDILRSISVDSRKIGPDDWFIPLKGEKNDGHDFIEQVVNLKPAGIFYSSLKPDYRSLRVKDTNNFLGEIASRWKQKVGPFTIALTGSNGKTSTKNLLAHMLNAISDRSVHATSGNHNNQFGVPYTLLGVKPSHRWLVVEIGTNHPGEIAPLSRWVQPDLTVITSISKGHIGNFTSLDDISFEKSQIVAGMKENRDKSLVTTEQVAGNPIVQEEARKKGVKIITPLENTVTLSGKDEAGMMVNFAEKTWHYPAFGNHQFQNLRLALKVLKTIGLSAEQLEAALGSLETLQVEKGRLQKVKIAGHDLWDDTYNANPDSFREAIDFVSSVATAKKQPAAGIFGMMGELGNYAVQEHFNLGFISAGFLNSVIFSCDQNELVNSFKDGWIEGGGKSDSLICCGNDDLSLKEIVCRVVGQEGFEGEILVKGSRSARMERVIEYIRSV